MVLLYMVTWIPSIYPPNVSIYTSTMDPSWGWNLRRNKKPGKMPVQWNVWLMNIELEHLGYGLERNYQRMDWFVGVENLICWSCTDFHGKIEHLAFWFSENICYDCWAYIEHFEKKTKCCILQEVHLCHACRHPDSLCFYKVPAILDHS